MKDSWVREEEVEREGEIIYNSSSKLLVTNEPGDISRVVSLNSRPLVPEVFLRCVVGTESSV